MNFPTHQIFFG